MASAATRTWTGAISSDFYNPTNWLLNDYPLAGDTLSISGGTVSISPAFTDSGQINWTGGSLSDALFVASGGVLSVGNAGACLDGSITNAGTMTLTGTLKLDSYNIQIVNQAGAMIDVQGDYSVVQNYGGNQQIINAGTFRKGAGTNNSTVNIPFFSTGTVEVRTGIIALPVAFTNLVGGFSVRLNSAADWGRLAFGVYELTALLGHQSGAAGLATCNSHRHEPISKCHEPTAGIFPPFAAAELDVCSTKKLITTDMP